MQTKWPTDLHRELNESEFQVLPENGVPKSIEKGANAPRQLSAHIGLEFGE